MRATIIHHMENQAIQFVCLGVRNSIHATTTFLCSIFLPVLVKATPCIDKDLGMCVGAYASLMVELQQDGYT